MENNTGKHQNAFGATNSEVTIKKEIVDGEEYIKGDTSYLKGDFETLQDAIKYFDGMSGIDIPAMSNRYVG